MDSRNQQIKGELHLVIIGLMLELGYPINEKILGLCGDFSDVIRKAFFNGQISKCNDVISYIDNEVKFDDLKKITKRLKTQNRQVDTNEDQRMVDTLDFFDEIAFHKTRLTTSRLFNNKPLENSEKSTEHHAEYVNEVLPSIRNYEEFILYFRQLYEQVQKLEINLSINISVGLRADSSGNALFEGHAFDICYNHVSKNWILADINQLPIKEKPASLDEICTFISDALNIIEYNQFDFIHTKLFSTSQNKNLLQQISRNVQDSIALIAPSESTIGLDSTQIEVLKELSEDGLKANHLRHWRSNDGNFTRDHSKALIYLIRNKSFTFEDAIEEISNLNGSQVMRICGGLKKQDLIGLSTFQVIALEQLAIFGLTALHLRKWQGDYFYDYHFRALEYLLKNIRMQPEAAIAKINGLNQDQSMSIWRYGKWPDGTKIQITPSTPRLANSFSIFNNELDSSQSKVESNVAMRPPSPSLL